MTLKTGRLILLSVELSTPAPPSPHHFSACPSLCWDDSGTRGTNAKPELDPDIPIPLPTLALCPRKGSWCVFWPKPRLFPGEAAMKLTSVKQQLASTGVAKAMPTSAVLKMNKGNTKRRSLAGGNQARILSLLPKVLLYGHTGTVKIADSYEKTLWEGKPPKR